MSTFSYFQIHSSQSRNLSKTELYIEILRQSNSNFSSLSIGRIVKGKTYFPVRKQESLFSSGNLRPETVPLAKRPITSNTINRATTTKISSRISRQQLQIRDTHKILDRRSSDYQNIYFGRTDFKNTLMDINKFPEDLVSLKPKDRKIPLLIAIVQKQFPEIEIQECNLLICQKKITEQFYVYFSDSEWVPFSSCCDKPIYLTIQVQNQNIDMFCHECERSLRDQFGEIPFLFNSEQRLKSNTERQNPNHEKDNHKLSRLVVTGKYKHSTIQLKRLKFRPLDRKMDDAEFPQIQSNFQSVQQNTNEEAEDKVSTYFKKFNPIQEPQQTQNNESTYLEIKNIINQWIS